MPKYFFHVYDGEYRVFSDTDGIELPNRLGVLEACRRIIEGELREAEFLGEIGENRSFRITDENDRIVEEVPFQ